MRLALQEYMSFIRHEMQFGIGVVVHDMVVLGKLLDQDRAMAKILDTCLERGWRCTFFMTARNLDKNKKWLNRIVEEGHEVGSHSFTHRLLPNLGGKELREEFELAKEAFEEHGVKPKGMRPPFLASDDRVRELAKEFHFKYLSSQHGGKSFENREGLWEHPVTRPYDWYGSVVLGKSPVQIVSHWETGDGPVRLIHPRYFDKIATHLDFGEATDLRVVANPSMALSFDVY